MKCSGVSVERTFLLKKFIIWGIATFFFKFVQIAQNALSVMSFLKKAPKRLIKKNDSVDPQLLAVYSRFEFQNFLEVCSFVETKYHFIQSKSREGTSMPGNYSLKYSQKCMPPANPHFTKRVDYFKG